MNHYFLVLSAVALVGLVGNTLIPSNAHASEYLGWDEESGIVNPDNYSLNAKNKPDSHKGWSEMNDSSNQTN